MPFQAPAQPPGAAAAAAELPSAPPSSPGAAAAGAAAEQAAAPPSYAFAHAPPEGAFSFPSALSPTGIVAFNPPCSVVYEYSLPGGAKMGTLVRGGGRLPQEVASARRLFMSRGAPARHRSRRAPRRAAAPSPPALAPAIGWPRA
jgi:hypothetical protein